MERMSSILSAAQYVLLANRAGLLDAVIAPSLGFTPVPAPTRPEKHPRPQEERCSVSQHSSSE